jgi:hypothetical protein
MSSSEETGQGRDTSLAVNRRDFAKMALGGAAILVSAGKFPIGWSLGIIAALIAASMALSLLLPRQRAVKGSQQRILQAKVSSY